MKNFKGSGRHGGRQLRWGGLIASVLTMQIGCGGSGNDAGFGGVVLPATTTSETPPAPPVVADCTVDSIQRIAPPGSLVDKADKVAAANGLPGHCSISAHYMSKGLDLEPDNLVNYYLRFPTDNWNGKLLWQGGGGFVGGYDDGLALSRGYAVGYTDAGHAGGASAKWADNNYTAVVDFGHRAVHESTVASKSLVAAYYGTPANRTYFAGCSTGGRQGLVAGERYPEDFDGILARAPALEYDGLMMAFAWSQQKLLRGPDYYIPRAKFQAVKDAFVQACDADDGLIDGLLSDPKSCTFDPASLACKSEDNTQCLSAGQLDTLKAILNGPANSSGERLFPPPYYVGDANEWGDWFSGYQAPLLDTDGSYYFPTNPDSAFFPLNAFFAWNYMKYMFFPKSDPQRDYRTFDFDFDPKERSFMGQTQNATGDLSKFKERGGKLIVWHGLADGVVYPERTLTYWTEAGTKSGGAMDQFARLYLAPGVAHCGGGDGPDLVGQAIDARHDLLEALDQWVTAGNAPDAIVATKRDDTQGVVRTRPLCPYPQKAVYKQAGSIDAAENFECR